MIPSDYGISPASDWGQYISIYGMLSRTVQKQRWSFRRLQSIVEYKAKLNGLNVIYVKAKGSSSYCPICGGKLSPNGYRRVMCKKCGIREDRDFIAVKNLLRKHQTDLGLHPFAPKALP